MFKEAVKVAEEMNIKMAVENHFDFDSDELLALIEDVGSPYFGLTFDTGNYTRLLDEPVKAMEKLGKYVFATHVKDVKITPNTRPMSGSSSLQCRWVMATSTCLNWSRCSKTLTMRVCWLLSWISFTQNIPDRKISRWKKASSTCKS